MPLLEAAKTVALSGFATLDYVITTPAPITGTGTWLADMHANANWPRAGGAPLYAAQVLAAAEHNAHPIVGVGEDGHGRIYARACETAGLRPSGIATDPNGKTPSCLLIYHGTGGYTCLLDPGAQTRSLTPQQLELIDQAHLVVIAAAPVSATRAILARLKPEQKLAWITKADPACFPADLCHDLSQRVDIIFCNESERGLITAPLRLDQMLLETLGSKGAQVMHGTNRAHLPADPIEVADATGAGDTFAGGVLAAYLSGETNLKALLEAGSDAARNLLLKRLKPSATSSTGA